MGLFTMTLPSATVPMLSVSHWALQLIDSVVLMAWPDTFYNILRFLTPSALNLAYHSSGNLPSILSEHKVPL